MFQCQHSETTSAAPWQLWARYRDPLTWAEWDDQIEDVTFDGEFRLGAVGTIKPVGGPRTRFRMTAVTEGVSFTDVTALPLARMRFDHWIEAGAGTTTFTHRVSITGPLAPLFARVIGRKVAAGLPGAMRALAALAERAAVPE
jgi:hypothetical protein